MKGGGLSSTCGLLCLGPDQGQGRMSWLINTLAQYEGGKYMNFEIYTYVHEHGNTVHCFTYAEKQKHTGLKAVYREKHLF